MTAELIPPAAPAPPPTGAVLTGPAPGAHPFALAPQPKTAMSPARHLRALLLFLLLAILIGGIGYPLAEAGIGTLLHAPPYPQPAPAPPPPANNSSTNSTLVGSTPMGNHGLTTCLDPSLRCGGVGVAGGGENERLLYERTLVAIGALPLPSSSGSLSAHFADGAL
jgi:hypothetical protein